MRRQDQQPMHIWLRAERAADDRLAERALGEVFAMLPEVAPSPGFRDRVLAASGIASAMVSPWGWRSRLALAACLLLVASSSAVLLPMVWELLGLLTPAEVVTALVDGGLTVSHRLHDVSPLWDLARTLYRTLLQVIAAPPVAVAISTMILLSAAALRSLMSLLPAQRSLGYA